MAGDNRLFQEHLKQGSAYAWNGQWERAVQEYRRALEEFPDDGAARTQLAMSLFKTGQLQEALVLYQQLWNVQPSNLPLLQRLAEVQEALGDGESALTSYQLLAEVYRRRRTPREALKIWQKAVKISPYNLALWDSLMEAAIQAGALIEIMPLYLNLARDLALWSRFEEAIQVVEKAQEADPQNPSVLEMLSAIRRALEHSWRAAAADEEITPEKLAVLIPPIPVVESSVDEKATPGHAIPPRPRLTFTVSQHRPPPPEIAATHQPPPPYTALSTDTPSVREINDVGKGFIPCRPLVHEAEGDKPLPYGGGQDHFGGALGEEPRDDDSLPERDEHIETGEEDRPALEAIKQNEEQSEEAAESPGVFEPSNEQPALEEPLESQDEAVETLEAETEGVLLPGTGIAKRLIELAETCESLGQDEEAVEAYKGALELSPGQPGALLGLARIHLSRGELDLAEGGIYQLLQKGEGCSEDVAIPAVEILLVAAKERANQGNLGATAETICWLQYIGSAFDLPADVTRMIAARSVEILGRVANEHLEEIMLLSPEDRQEVIDALKRIEALLEGGKLRSSADEVYGLITVYPDFLPAQRILAEILLAQGRQREAEGKARWLAELYDMRGDTLRAQKVERWIAQAGITGGDTGDQLVELQMEEPLKEPLEEPEEVQVGNAAWETEDNRPSWEVMLDHAEIGIASGRRDTAVELVRAALDMDEGRNPAARTALLRILQVMKPDEAQRGELAELLRKLGQPQLLAD